MLLELFVNNSAYISINTQFDVPEKLNLDSEWQ